MTEQQNNFPYVEIIEQPASKTIRFRYECEGRATGYIHGENNEPDKKTYPTIRIVGYKGRAVIVVSSVTVDEPYKPHPNSIIGKDMNHHGVCTLQLHTHQDPIILTNLRIQCVRRKDVNKALELRKKIRVDPFKAGFDIDPLNIDLGVIRLCFQVFLEGQNGKFQIPLAPVVSNPIYDKKAKWNLTICKLSHCSAPMTGGTEIIILCEKIHRDNIQVVFYETQNDEIVWRDFGEFNAADVHKQVAIALRTPAYPSKVDHPVEVFIQLRRPRDGGVSEPVLFTLIPTETVGSTLNSLKRKRQKCNPRSISFSRILQDYNELDDQSNQQKFQKKNYTSDEDKVMSLKDITPSVFSSHSIPNLNNSWIDMGKEECQMPLKIYQNKVAPLTTVQPESQPIPTAINQLSPPVSTDCSSLTEIQAPQANNQNEEPMLFKIMESPRQNLLGDESINTNHLNFVHSIDALKELNSEELAGLSEIFSSTMSLTEQTELYPDKNSQF